jgi:putative redox protein
MNVYLKRVKGSSLVAKGDSNHWLNLDTLEEAGGSNAAPTPMELVLMALAGCGSMDILSILKKKRVKVDDFEVNVTAERSTEHPKVFTKINIEYIFYGNNILPADVERAIELSYTKYCSVHAMLKTSVEINKNYKILESRE